MNFSDPLIRGRFVERYKRFLSTIELDGGESITAHCPNPGSMAGLLVPSGEVWLSPSRNPKRKLRYTWELVCINGGYVGINTLLANRIVEEGLNAKKIRELADYSSIRREVRYGKNSRVDFLLEAPEKPPCYVEVKSVTLRLGESAAFPDAVTARGTKHLSELTEVVRSGKRAVIFTSYNAKIATTSFSPKKSIGPMLKRCGKLKK